MTDVRISDGRDRGTRPGFNGAGGQSGGITATVVAFAAAIAVLIAILVAAALTGPAAAATAPLGDAPAVVRTVPAAEAATRTTMLIGEAAPVRDMVFHVAASGHAPKRSMAMVVVTALLVAMTAAASLAWRALGRSVVSQPVRRVIASARRRPDDH